jgi:hypothetical protein
MCGACWCQAQSRHFGAARGGEIRQGLYQLRHKVQARTGALLIPAARLSSGQQLGCAGTWQLCRADAWLVQVAPLCMRPTAGTAAGTTASRHRRRLEGGHAEMLGLTSTKACPSFWVRRMQSLQEPAVELQACMPSWHTKTNQFALCSAAARSTADAPVRPPRGALLAGLPCSGPLRRSCGSLPVRVGHAVQWCASALQY